MAKSKSPPDPLDRIDLSLELAPLIMAVHDFMRTSNDLDSLDIYSTMILATITVGDGADHPLTAESRFPSELRSQR
jgi:hypothetical protein